MVDDDEKDRSQKSERAAGTTPVQPTGETGLMKRAGEAVGPVAAEIITEALKQERQQSIDVNVLLVQIVQKAHDPVEILKSSGDILAIARRYDDDRFEAFKKRVEFTISAKQRDPDDCEKRSNNATGDF